MPQLEIQEQPAKTDRDGGEQDMKTDICRELYAR